jgi:hypothetical protein
VAVVCGVAVTVVHVVDVISMLHCLVPTVRPVLVVGMVQMRGMNAFALVPVPIVLVMHVAIMEVVGVTVVFDGCMATTCAVLVLMIFVDCVDRGHEGASSACSVAG